MTAVAPAQVVGSSGVTNSTQNPLQIAILH